jgi:hypothetical protein
MIVETSKGKLPVKYGWKALRKFGELCEKDMNQVIEMITEGLSETWKGWRFTDMYNLLYVGFWYGALKSGEECQIKDGDEVEDLLDDDPNLTNRVSKILIDDFMDMFSDKTGDKKK